MIRYHCAFWPDHSLEYGLQAMESGLDGIEIQSCQSYISQEKYDAYMRDIQILLDKGAGLTIHAPIIDISLGSTNHRIRKLSIQHIFEAAELALKLGASIVVVHGGMGVLTMPPGSWSAGRFRDSYQARQARLSKVHDLVVESVREIADRYPSVTIGLENLVYPHELYRFPEEMLALTAQIDRPNVGLTLDIGHAATVGQEAVGFLNAVKEELVHVHMHDNNGVRDEHLPLGKGQIDYRSFLATLSDIRYEGAVAFEFSLPNPGDFRHLVSGT
jgi:sugar phosphate isomerase/epimerase